MRKFLPRRACGGAIRFPLCVLHYLPRTLNSFLISRSSSSGSRVPLSLLRWGRYVVAVAHDTT